MSSPESSFSNSVSISDSLDDFGMPPLSFFEDLYFLFQIVFLLLVSLTAERISSPDTPATVSCKQKLLTALHNSLLIVWLDIWQQNIFVFGEQRVGRLLDFSIIGVVERNF
jgi:hypothetical protein